jgi:hypothetical protein
MTLIGVGRQLSKRFRGSLLGAPVGFVQARMKFQKITRVMMS